MLHLTKMMINNIFISKMKLQIVPIKIVVVVMVTAIIVAAAKVLSLLASVKMIATMMRMATLIIRIGDHDRRRHRGGGGCVRAL